MSILFAATYPEKVSALILGSAFARWFPAPDYRCGPGAEQAYAAMEEIATHRWGQGATIDWFLPSRSGSSRAREALARFERMAISPTAFLRMIRMIREIDVRAVLPAIHVPTLVIQRGGTGSTPLLRALPRVPYRGRAVLRAARRPRPTVRRRRGASTSSSPRSKSSSRPHHPHPSTSACSPQSSSPRRHTTRPPEGDAARHRQAVDLGQVAKRHVRGHQGRVRDSTKRASSRPSTRQDKRSAAPPPSATTPPQDTSSYVPGSTPAK